MPRSKTPSNSRPKVLVKKKVKVATQKDIVSLQRKIATINNKAKGSIQRNLQTIDEFVTPTSGYPVLFDISNMVYGQQYGCPIYQEQLLGQVQPVARFMAYDPGGDSQTQFWTPNNTDVCNDTHSGRYYPKSASMRFQFSGNPSLDDCRIKIQIFKMKRGAVRPRTGMTPETTNQSLALPSAINGLAGMCTDNFLNPTFFKKLYEKNLYLNSAGDLPETTTQTNTTGNSKFCTINWKFPRNFRMNQTTTGQNYSAENVPYTQPFWCLVSTNDQLATLSDAVNMKLTRMVEWRDEIGSASLTQ